MNGLPYTTDTERIFLALVRAYRGIGYGRMMQIVSHEWYRHDRVGALLANTCYGLLPEEDRRAYEALAQSDPVFKEHTDDLR